VTAALASAVGVRAIVYVSCDPATSPAICHVCLAGALPHCAATTCSRRRRMSRRSACSFPRRYEVHRRRER
jgi:hypothetical protein